MRSGAENNNIVQGSKMTCITKTVSTIWLYISPDKGEVCIPLLSERFLMFGSVHSCPPRKRVLPKLGLSVVVPGVLPVANEEQRHTKQHRGHQLHQQAAWYWLHHHHHHHQHRTIGHGDCGHRRRKVASVIVLFARPPEHGFKVARRVNVTVEVLLNQ